LALLLVAAACILHLASCILHLASCILHQLDLAPGPCSPPKTPHSPH
jgi:hypothetical protein